MIIKNIFNIKPIFLNYFLYIIKCPVKRICFTIIGFHWEYFQCNVNIAQVLSFWLLFLASIGRMSTHQYFRFSVLLLLTEYLHANIVAIFHVNKCRMGPILVQYIETFGLLLSQQRKSISCESYLEKIWIHMNKS